MEMSEQRAAVMQYVTKTNNSSRRINFTSSPSFSWQQAEESLYFELSKPMENEKQYLFVSSCYLFELSS